MPGPLASETKLDAHHHRSGEAGPRTRGTARHDVGGVREILNAREDAHVFRDVELAENIHHEVRVRALAFRAGLSETNTNRR